MKMYLGSTILLFFAFSRYAGVSANASTITTANTILWGCTSQDTNNDGVIQIQKQGLSQNLTLAHYGSSGFWVTTVSLAQSRNLTPSDQFIPAVSAPSDDQVEMFVNYQNSRSKSGEGHALLKTSDGYEIFNGPIVCQRGERVINGAINFWLHPWC